MGSIYEGTYRGGTPLRGAVLARKRKELRGNRLEEEELPQDDLQLVLLIWYKLLIQIINSSGNQPTYKDENPPFAG
jgi:hypothetical protein